MDADHLWLRSARKLYVAGPFGSTADTSSSVPLRKVTIASITSTTSLSTSPSPSVLIDDTISDDPSQSWLGVNGGTSTLVLDLGYSQEVSAIKLRNTRVDGRGTFEFRVTCGSLQQVRYLDEYTKNQDNTNVPKLSRLDPLVSQMYYLVNSPSCRELTITVRVNRGGMARRLTAFVSCSCRRTMVRAPVSATSRSSPAR